MHDINVLERAVECLGSAAALAKAIGVSPMAVSHWRSARRALSAVRAKQIEQATNGQVRRHELRPDLFDAPATEVAA